jgi:hypothetical protein
LRLAVRTWEEMLCTKLVKMVLVKEYVGFLEMVVLGTLFEIHGVSLLVVGRVG